MSIPFLSASFASLARRATRRSFSLGLALPLLVLWSCGKVSEPANSSPKSQANGSLPASAANAQDQDAEQLLELGKTTLSKGDSERAIRLFQKALEKDAGLTEARFALGTALVPMAGAAEMGSGTKDPKIMATAVGHLRQVCEAEPENAEYHYWLGRMLDVAGQETEAASVLARATELDPEHGKAFKRLGLVHKDLGNLEAAKLAWIRAGELLPQDGGVFFNLGNLFFEDDLERSNEYYKQATLAEPTSPKGYLGLSKTLALKGDIQGASEAKRLFESYQAYEQELKSLVRYATDSPKDESAQFAAAEMYFVLKQYDSSLAMFRRVLHLNPRNAFAHFYIAKILTEWGELESALNHYEECVFYEPGVPDSLLALLETCVALGNEVRAEELCETLEPIVETPANHAKFSELLRQLGEETQADAHAAKAKRKDE